ncbi:hypothetical protein G9C85_05630 [Halorubellus sp. JP-L1]|uniref:HalOD1 output domain-containing protein n=1 Tax=Halorubellus sp. JP-L1 TaxID=2715753 RepID=UPI00140918A6|nr:HalOD1 output domain-containing protein [Halorubellus sp. JP-L1]NHN41116.1 hypothetical protein [Halorubellus sp. JP-L1]
MSDTGSDDVFHRQLQTDVREPAEQVAEHVANIAGEEVTDLESTWECFDHLLDEIFQDPPAPDAQVQVTFTYEGYRITVEQDGHATFVPVGDPPT